MQHRCAVCGLVIPREEATYLEVVVDLTSRGLWLHPECYHAVRVAVLSGLVKELNGHTSSDRA